MQGLVDFLSFKLFISPYVLVICYYVGAVGVPVASWLLAAWLKAKLSPASDAINIPKKVLIGTTTFRSRIMLLSFFIVFFISMEIMWRMLFEFLIAYLQMREALMELAAHF